TTIRELTRGAHRVRVERDGYVDEDRRIVITAARPSQSVAVELKRPRAAQAARAGASVPGGAVTSATLAIDSRPAGAKVFIDGKLAGTTPLVVPAIASGDHAIRLERDGYRQWSSSVRVAAGERNR